MLDEHAGTGRTTRMLARALTEARKGKRITILARDKDHMGYLEQKLQRLANESGLDWILNANLRVMSVDSNMVRERQPGGHWLVLGRQDDSEVWPDHSVLEGKYGTAIDSWLKASQ